MAAAMYYAYAAECSVYLRMGKSDRGDIHTGSMVRAAVDIAQGLDLVVWSAPVLKPLHADDVCAAARAANGLVTLGEYSFFCWGETNQRTCSD